MSSTREDEIILNFINNVECTLFIKDGIVDDKILEQIASCTSEPLEILDEIKEILVFLPTGDYHKILNGKFAKLILAVDTEIKSDYASFLKEQISKLLSSTSSTIDCYLRQLHVLLLGIACLQLVVQQNWLGPPLKNNEINFLSKCFEFKEKDDLQISDYLRKDGEEVYVLAEYLEYLLVARTILVDCRDLLVNLKTQSLWEMRCILVHQQLLEEPSSSLKAEIMSALERIDFSDKNSSSEMLFRMYLETGYNFLQYFECGKAKEQFENAQKCVGLELYLGGALGKRTKFQQIDYTQLLAKAKVDNCTENGECEKLDVENLPKDVALDDDTLLNNAKFTNPEDNIQDKLTSLHLAAILADCIYKQKSQAHHELLDEEILANVTLLVSQPRVWSVQSIALLLRSKYEKKSSRRKERSMMQIQQLVDQFSDSKAKLSQRLELFYSVSFPAKWKLQRELANLYLELGVTKSALDVYERLQLWEDVINCYISLGRFEKAESVVRTQLKIKETPKLWCLLGDVTKDGEFYRKAWDISGHRSARAQRSLGYLYLRDKKFQTLCSRSDQLDCILGRITSYQHHSRPCLPRSSPPHGRIQSLTFDRQFEESVPCFQKSLEINSLQENVWFSLGCAAMVTKNLELAAKAFHWCVSMNPDDALLNCDDGFRPSLLDLPIYCVLWSDNSEAWNNLSSIYIKMKKKDRAFRTLQEAIRANYDNWHMWENFLVVSTDVGAFEQVLQAFHRLMDLKEKYLDVEVLGILVQSVIGGREDNKGLNASRLKAKVKELMGRITSQITGNADVWKLYSDLYKDGESEEEKDKFLQFLVKANGVNVQNPGWEKSQERIDNVVQISLELSKAYHDTAQGQEKKTQAIQLLSSSKLNLKGLITKLKKNADCQISEEMDNCLSESLSKLEAELERTVNAIDILKSALNR